MTEEKKELSGSDPNLNASESEREEQTSRGTESELITETPESTEVIKEGQAPAEQEESTEHLSPLSTEDENVTSTTVTNDTDDSSKEGTSETSARQGSNGIWIGISTLLAVLLIISLFKSPFAQRDFEQAVVTVNNGKITKGELYEALVEAGAADMINAMIDDELINQEAEKAKVTVTDAEIKRERDFYLEQFGSEEVLKQLLDQYGMTDEDFERQITKEAKIRQLLGPKVKVTDEQVSSYFEENKAQFNTPAEVQASQIVVATEKEAKDIISELNGGADFAALAKEKSIDPATKEKGGDLGFFAKDAQQIDPATSTAAFALKKGETSSAVLLSDGQYAVLKVTDTKEPHVATLDEKREEIQELLTTQQISELSVSWLEDLRKNAKIVNTLSEDETSAEAPETSETP